MMAWPVPRDRFGSEYAKLSFVPMRVRANSSPTGELARDYLSSAKTGLSVFPFRQAAGG
jgi:hypothetical protein